MPRTSPTMMRSGRIRKRVLHEVARHHFAASFGVRRARLEAHDVLLLQAQLGGVLDRHDTLARPG